LLLRQAEHDPALFDPEPEQAIEIAGPRADGEVVCVAGQAALRRAHYDTPRARVAQAQVKPPTGRAAQR
jgi:hypothetical protein